MRRVVIKSGLRYALFWDCTRRKEVVYDIWYDMIYIWYDIWHDMTSYHIIYRIVSYHIYHMSYHIIYRIVSYISYHISYHILYYIISYQCHILNDTQVTNISIIYNMIRKVFSLSIWPSLSKGSSPLSYEINLKCEVWRIHWRKCEKYRILQCWRHVKWLHWRGTRSFPPKRRYIWATLYGIAYQKTLSLVKLILLSSTATGTGTSSATSTSTNVLYT